MDCLEYLYQHKDVTTKTSKENTKPSHLEIDNLCMNASFVGTKDDGKLLETIIEREEDKIMIFRGIEEEHNKKYIIGIKNVSVSQKENGRGTYTHLKDAITEGQVRKVKLSCQGNHKDDK